MTEIYIGNFNEYVAKAPSADLSIFGMRDDLQFEIAKELTIKTKNSCLFVKDSGHESILA